MSPPPSARDRSTVSGPSPPTRLFTGLAVVLVAVLAAVTVLAVAGAGPATAGHPPLSVCGVCGSDGIDGATGSGTLDIRLDERGDARFVARVPVDDDAAATYRTDSDALESAVEAAWYRYDVATDEATDLEASVEDGRVRVGYDVPDVAQSRVGDGWVVDYFYAADTQYRYGLRADRVTIHAPDGMAVTNDPANAAVEGRSATWTADSGITKRTYLTYGPTGVDGTVASWGSAAAVFGPELIDHGLRASVVPVAVVGLAVLAAGRLGGRHRGAAGDRERAVLERATGTVGLEPTGRTLFALVVVASGLVAVGCWLTVGPGLGVLTGTFGLAVGLFLPFGYALERSGGRWIGLLAMAAPIAATTAFAPYYVLGFGPLAGGAFFVPWAVVAALVGYRLSLTGRALAADYEG
ncbi:hypothetical protein SAMN05444422_1197 [Halobiforma haloterrestris]|uniref:Uncharacterized protein n=1 Tax=Natronobacterium haloterrestre TaxID=148448 RepID=A0A1I1LLM2_NATHA|nr:hypothetical protein [Halobiforma haloterrestris]SFC74097.1 hypothetical protein SAMN05444422_1197 [Halobiforma haloterrestris]